MYVDIPEKKPRVKNTKSKKLPPMKEPLIKCRVVPVLVHLYPELVEHSLKFTPNYKDLYTSIVLSFINIKNSLHDNLDLLYNIKN